MKYVLCSNGSGIDEKVRSVNRSWTPASYFSLRKPIHREEVRGKCKGGMFGYRNKGAQISCFVPGRRIPQLRHWRPNW